MVAKHEINGIVVCGGQSSRMGKDKSRLVYHRQPQWQYLYGLLSASGIPVHISVNEAQAATLPSNLPLLTDMPVYRQCGPMAALLTAFEQLPGRDMLFIGCDYPFLQAEELNRFRLFALKEGTMAAFYNEKENLYEPLLAFYPAAVAAEVREYFRQGNYSLQSLLRQFRGRKYYPEDPVSINSIDTPEQYAAARKITGLQAGLEKED